MNISHAISLLREGCALRHFSLKTEKTYVYWLKRYGAFLGNEIFSPGQADTGTSDWKRRMIERLRLQHYSWRTEQTYQEWARRFAKSLGTKATDMAAGDDAQARERS